MTPEERELLRERFRESGRKGGLARAAKYTRKEMGGQVHGKRDIPPLPEGVTQLPQLKSLAHLTPEEKLARRRMQKRLWWLRNRGLSAEEIAAKAAVPKRVREDLSHLTDEEKWERHRQRKNDLQREWRKKRSDARTAETGLTPDQRRGNNRKFVDPPSERPDTTTVEFTGWGKSLTEDDFKPTRKRAEEETF